MTIKQPCPRCQTLVARKTVCPRCGVGVGIKASSTRRGYGAQWRKLAATAIALAPWCVECGATDDLTADHVVPLASGGEVLPDLMGGVQVLCRACNGRKGRKMPRPPENRPHF